ncbi:MAG: hypothetical protein ACI85U_000695, partial [Candidatus Promineifilaceae bacterium]
MSHDKHDQNKGLETADTAPSRIRVIGYALLSYLLVACVVYFFLYGLGGLESTGEDLSAVVVDDQDTGNFPPAAYFISPTNLNLIPEQIQLGNLHSAADPVELATKLGTFPEIRIIFIDGLILENEEYTALLSKQFEAGKMIVGLRTSHAQLSQTLGLSPQLPDLSQSKKVNSVIWVSAWYLDQNGEPAEISQSWEQF